MHSTGRLILLLAIGIASSSTAKAQIVGPNKVGVSMGHLHYHVQNVDSNKRFWTVLGGKAIKIGDTDVMKFPGVLVFLTNSASSGGADGSILNHVAFRVPSLAQVSAAGLTVIPVEGFPGVASVMTPDGERVELFEDAAKNLTFTEDPGYNDTVAERHNRPVGEPIAFHHIHMYVPEKTVPEVKSVVRENVWRNARQAKPVRRRRRAWNESQYFESAAGNRSNQRQNARPHWFRGCRPAGVLLEACIDGCEIR
jgi:hypothetical protein